MEECIESTIVFDGRIVSVRVDQVELPGGGRSTREVVKHPGAVAIVPITTSGNVLFVEQYRYAVNRTLLEIPAGTRETGESPLETARRELEEETGYRAASLVEIGRFFVSPGWATEEIVLYRAEALDSTGHGFDHDEMLDVLEIEPARIPVLMREGKIADAKTIVGLQLALANVQ